MLPAQLSNGICSLNPDSVRLAISVFMELTDAGELSNFNICSSLISIDERLTYSAVNRLLKGNGGWNPNMSASNKPYPICMSWPEF